jgi:hypothetical protein
MRSSGTRRTARRAEAFERIADPWGRQIGYGEPPNEPSDAELGQEEIDLEGRTRTPRVRRPQPGYELHLDAMPAGSHPAEPTA